MDEHVKDQPNDMLDALKEVQELQHRSSDEYDISCDDYWNSLSQEDQLKSFHSVVKRIVQGELKNNGSYRHILYDVFGFGPEAYAIGMNCGFLTLHNHICTDEELTKLREMRYNEAGYSLKETITVDLNENEKDDGS